MPYTLVAWSESQDSAVLIETAAVADPHLTVAGDIIRVPEFASQLIGVYGLGVNVTRAQLRSPSLRRVVNLEISPLDRLALPGSPVVIAMFPDSPLSLDVDEDLTALMAEDAVGASRVTILAFLADGAIGPVSGEVFTVRVTAAAGAAANVWNNGALTFDQQLPSGLYAVVGAQMVGTNLVAFRFVFPGGFIRPGGIGSDAVNDLVPPGQRRGGWGEWGRFFHTVPPTLDSLYDAAPGAITGALDLIKVG